MKKVLGIIFLAAAVVLGGILIAVTGQKNDIVIDQGIQFFRNTRMVLGITGGASMVLGILFLLLSGGRKKGEKKPAGNSKGKRTGDVRDSSPLYQEEPSGGMQDISPSGPKTKAASKLSASRKLRNHELRELLNGYAEGDFSSIRSVIDPCITQMNKMDDYQERLHVLLTNNDAGALSDTEEILDRAEQYLCRNVRKVLNYMSIADSSRPEERSMVKDKLSDCCSENADVLRQVQEFLVALTEFLNHQGESEQDISMLEIYKKTILDSIQEM